ncbi:MAG: phytanoyl-CoA dioxygenase family protein [Bacteroidetes bacterium]|nr:phytanoyl-CoA dioxygenase family protein [Bacteroidota bacterium]
MAASLADLEKYGFSIISNVYSSEEVAEIVKTINSKEIKDQSVSNSKNVYAIRQLLASIPELAGLLFSDNLKNLLRLHFGHDFFLTKAIYFNKPKDSNWFVAYHQDLSITVNQKAEVDGYTNWTFKKGQYGVQPPVEVLENTLTIRIHLDNTDSNNGALAVKPSTHQKGVIRLDSDEWKAKADELCKVEAGGVMLMKPLLLHTSKRSKINEQRRVIHLEFNNTELAKPLKWKERMNLS